jgi:quercetin dioxygenase-like cupin family protein
MAAAELEHVVPPRRAWRQPCATLGAMSDAQSGRAPLAPSLDVVLRRFDAPDETRVFDMGRFEIVRIGGMTIGRATYQPGWRWSVHVGSSTGETSCEVEHVGMVVSGCATAAMRDGRVIEMRAGDIFYIPPGHDSWVVGDQPYVSLHFVGGDEYARAKS